MQTAVACMQCRMHCTVILKLQACSPTLVLSLNTVEKSVPKSEFTIRCVHYTGDQYTGVVAVTCSSGYLARANQLYYRFRTVFRVRNGIVTLYKSFVRLIPPSDLACVRACVRARVLTCVRVSSYRAIFFSVSTRIHNNLPYFSQIQIRDRYV